MDEKAQVGKDRVFHNERRRLRLSATGVGYIYKGRLLR